MGESDAPLRVEAPETDVKTTVLVAEQEEIHLTAPWKVILFNDDIHTFEEVILQVVKATGCSIDDAERHAWKVHLQGMSCVFDGVFEKCLRVQGVLKQIALVTEIQG